MRQNNARLRMGFVMIRGTPIGPTHHETPDSYAGPRGHGPENGDGQKAARGSLPAGVCRAALTSPAYPERKENAGGRLYRHNLPK